MPRRLTSLRHNLAAPAPLSALRQAVPARPRAILALSVLAGCLALGAPATAGATVPGANGKLAFSSTRDGNLEIHTMNADGSGETNLTQNAAWDDGPAWSPDGQKLAFRSDRDGNGEVYRMDPDGSNQTNLTQNAAEDGNPAWQTIIAADLGVSVTAPASVKSKSTMTYTVTVTNHGPSRAKNLQLVDELPYGTVFNSATVPAGWTCTTPRQGKGGRVSCTLTTVTADLDRGLCTVTRNSLVPAYALGPDCCDVLHAPSAPLGLASGLRPACESVPLHPGVRIVAVTDGISNAGARSGRALDLREYLLARARSRPPDPGPLARDLLGAALELDSGRPTDDMTVAVIGIVEADTEDDSRTMVVRVPVRLRSSEPGRSLA